MNTTANARQMFLSYNIDPEIALDCVFAAVKDPDAKMDRDEIAQLSLIVLLTACRAMREGNAQA